MQNTDPHILKTFDEALNGLRDDILVMGSLAVRSFENAMQGVLERDSERCKLTIADDEEIDEYEVKADRDGFETILRYQPIATDLRNVVSSIKLSTNLERVGDQSVTIARRGNKLNQHAPLPETRELQPLFLFAREQLKTALECYSKGDIETAKSHLTRDAELDVLCKNYERHVSNRMTENVDVIRGYLNLLFISRAIERVGDHAKNILEDVIYIGDAIDVRHQKPL